METAPVAQKKNGEDGHQKKQPHLLRRFSRADADVLRQAGQVFPATQQKTLNTFLGVNAPVVLASESGGELADLARELAGAGLIHKPGQRLSQTSALPGNPRPYQKTEKHQSNQKQKVNDGDRPDAAADQFLQSLHCGINEIGKKNGEEEENQRSPRRIQKAQTNGEQESREQNARRA